MAYNKLIRRHVIRRIMLNPPNERARQAARLNSLRYALRAAVFNMANGDQTVYAREKSYYLRDLTIIAMNRTHYTNKINCLP